MRMETKKTITFNFYVDQCDTVLMNNGSEFNFDVTDIVNDMRGYDWNHADVNLKFLKSEQCRSQESELIRGVIR